MADKEIIQNIINLIDSRITENIDVNELARESGYSSSHLARVFSRETGVTLMAYITRRKLQYAMYNIGCGEKILDVAIKYGFETHAGFTKAFRRIFGCPPSIYHIHTVSSNSSEKEKRSMDNFSGGELLKPAILEIQPFTVVGFTSRHKIPDVRFTHDVPLYWETIKMNYWDPLTRLHDLFTKSGHTEYSVCFEVDSETSEFTYLLGVGVNHPEDYLKIESDMYEMTMPGGLYARFTTPGAKISEYIQVVRSTWKSIFDEWLPVSEFEFDETRYDFEYYDERDHIYKGKDWLQMDIFIPVQKR